MGNDTNTRVIIDVAINSQDAAKKANDLGAAIDQLRVKQVMLAADNKKGTVEYLQNADAIRRTTAEQKAYVQISLAAEGSNNQLRAQLALTTQQYNALSKEEREGTLAGKALQVQIRSISDELKQNESAVGDNRRNVGNYKGDLQSATDGIKNQTQELTALGGSLGQTSIGFQLGANQVKNLASQIGNFREATEQAKAAQTEFQQAQEISNQATEAANKAKELATTIGFKFTQGQATATQVQAANTAATQAQTVATAAAATATEAQAVATTAATNATKIFKVALASTGIGAVVVIVVALINYLSKFDPIIDKVEQGFAAIGSVINRVTGIVVDFFSNIQSVGDFLSKMKGILSDPIGSFNTLAREINNVARASVNLKKAQQDLEDQVAIQEVNNAKAIQQVKELTLQARNRSLSEKERTALLKQAAKIEEDNFKNQKKISDEKTRIVLEDLKVNANVTDGMIKDIQRLGLAEIYRLKDTKKITNEQADAFKAAELERIKTLEETTNRQEKNQNLQDALAEKAQAAAEKRAERAKKLDEDRKDAERERLESILKVNEFNGTERENELNAIDNEIKSKKEKYKAYGATLQQLEVERLARRKQVNEEYDKQNQQAVRETLQAVEDLQIAQIQNSADREIAQIAVTNQRKLAAQDELIALTREKIAAGETALTELLSAQQIERDAILSEGKFIIDEKNAEITEAQRQKEIERDQSLADARQKIREEEIANQDAALGLVQAIFDKNTAMGKAAFLVEKALAVSRILIQTQASLAANRLAEQLLNAQLSAVPLVGGFLAAANSVKAQAERTRIIIAGALSAATVVATAVSGFSQGGVFESDGRGAVLSGYSKTDNTNAKLRSGEAVIVSEAARDPNALAALSAINVAYGGRPLAPGYAMATGGIAQGGFVSGIANNVSAQNETANLVMQAVQLMPPPVVAVEQILSATAKYENNVVNATI